MHIRGENAVALPRRRRAWAWAARRWGGGFVGTGDSLGGGKTGTSEVKIEQKVVYNRGNCASLA